MSTSVHQQTHVNLANLANAIRFLSVDAILKAGEGHQGVPLGMAEIATTLYAEQLKFMAHAPGWWDRDRVVLSNGHGSMLLYSLLYLTGNEHISLDQIKRFRELGSHCAGHPEFDIASGIEVTTGPLGQGIGNALGMAIAEAYLNARFGDALVNHFTYAFVGDGCLQEGVGQEMISLAGHLGLGKLVLLWDDNQITDDGSTDLSISESVPARFSVAGWQVIEVDGHNIVQISSALASAKLDSRPSLIACRTKIAKGLTRLEGQRGGHSAKLFDADANAMRDLFEWQHLPFEIPSDILQNWRDIGNRNSAEYAAWQRRFSALPDEEKSEFERVMRGELPQDWQEALLTFKRDAIASRLAIGGINLSAAINDALFDLLPERMVACADLEAPTGHKQRLQSFTAKQHAGAYLHCGVREHVMGALANGMAAHGGVIATTVTYLAFADYERPAMRMAAMMGLPVKFVFSHDSIGIGKNGPTHQPVEILASLRAMPNMLVMRPADAAEAAECWQFALAHRTGPVSLVFARQTLQAARKIFSDENLVERGAYVLSQESLTISKARQITLLATGSEVDLAMRAQKVLEDLGYATAVVSMPCWELFEQQSIDYKKTVLGPTGVRIGIEAAMRFGWDRYLRDCDDFVGMSGFGASGPADELYAHFEITVPAIVQKALACLKNAHSFRVPVLEK
jgi:transketolase